MLGFLAITQGSRSFAPAPSSPLSLVGFWALFGVFRSLFPAPFFLAGLPSCGFVWPCLGTPFPRATHLVSAFLGELCFSCLPFRFSDPLGLALTLFIACS